MTIIPFKASRAKNRKLYAVTNAPNPDAAIKAVIRMKKESQKDYNRYDWELGKIRRTGKTIELYDLRVKGEAVFVVWKKAIR